MDSPEEIRTDPFAYLNEESIINILGFIGTNTYDPNRPSIGYERLKWLGVTAESRQYFDPEDQSTKNVRGICGVVGAARLSCVLAAVCKSWRDFMKEHSNRIAPGLELNLFQLKFREAEPVYQWMVRTQVPIRSLIFDVYADRDHEELLLEYLPLCNTDELITAHITVPKDGLDRGRMGADTRLQDFLAEHCPKLKNLRINLYTRILSIWAGWNCCPEEFPAISPALRSKPSIECVNLVINKPQNLNVDLNINAKLFSWFIQDWPSLRYFQLACNCKPRPAMQIRSNTLEKLYVSKCLDGFLFDLDCPKLKIFGFGGREVNSGVVSFRQKVNEARNIPEDCQAVFLGDDYSENLAVPFRLVLEDNRADLLQQIQAMFPISTRENRTNHPYAQLRRARFEREGGIDVFDDDVNDDYNFRRHQDNRREHARRLMMEHYDEEFLRQLGGLQPGEFGPLPRELINDRHTNELNWIERLHLQEDQRMRHHHRLGHDRDHFARRGLRPGRVIGPVGQLPRGLAEDDLDDYDFDRLPRRERDRARLELHRHDLMLRREMREMMRIGRERGREEVRRTNQDDNAQRPHYRPRQGQGQAQEQEQAREQAQAQAQAQVDAEEPTPLARVPAADQNNNEAAPPRRSTFTDNALSMLEFGRELIASVELFQDPPI